MTVHESLTDSGVLELVMDNPKVNALPIADTDRLAEILNGIEHRGEVTAVILTATGRGFSAGVDVKEMQQMPGNTGIIEVNRACLSAFRAVYRCAVPVICAVNDFCFGTGIGLAGSADIVVAAQGARFGLPEIDNGALGAASYLGRLVPEKHLRWMLYSCEPATAEQLEAWGTVLRVVPLEELMDAAREIAAAIASKHPTVMRAAKASLVGIDDDPSRGYRLEQGFTFELNLHGLGDEARDAFLRGERRSKPVDGSA
ncbi:MAG: enoyl-CoA hydratase family protein [Acidimicrobiaceae bacterium]|nr:enoyl-CoA hydratase family protein [Acidimicrobiaceae bacterium]MDE0605798.1 enoyl-CoA hydratase family protein [Acidimicrobiaceae bacterium]